MLPGRRSDGADVYIKQVCCNVPFRGIQDALPSGVVGTNIGGCSAGQLLKGGMHVCTCARRHARMQVAKSAMACIVMAYIVMAYSYGLYRHGLYSQMQVARSAV